MSATADTAAGGGIGALGRGLGRVSGAVLPVLTVVACIIALWYAAAIGLNRAWTLDTAQRQGAELTAGEIIADAMSQERPVLPAPHQVAAELFGTPRWASRSCASGAANTGPIRGACSSTPGKRWRRR